jgi:hypothetical protein
MQEPKPEFEVFRNSMRLNLEDIDPDKEHLERFIRSQWDLLQDGIRDVRIHDAACIAWSSCGGRF